MGGEGDGLKRERRLSTGRSKPRQTVQLAQDTDARLLGSTSELVGFQSLQLAKRTTNPQPNAFLLTQHPISSAQSEIAHATRILVTSRTRLSFSTAG